MSVELLIGNELGTKAYLPAVKEGIEWTTERKNTPGKLSFEVLKDDALNFSEYRHRRCIPPDHNRPEAPGSVLRHPFVLWSDRPPYRILLPKKSAEYLPAWSGSVPAPNGDCIRKYIPTM